MENFVRYCEDFYLAKSACTITNVDKGNTQQAATEHVSVYVISALWKISPDEDSLCSSNGQVGAIDVEHNIYLFFSEAVDELLGDDKALLPVERISSL